MLVDSHCHLSYPEFANLPDFLKRAENADVKLLQTISTKRSDFAVITKIAEENKQVFCSIGIHPHEAEDHTDIKVAELVKWAAHPKVIGIGETGLDYFYEHSPREIQKTLFHTHIEAARQLKLPLIIHSRDADDDMMAILEEEMGKGAFTFLLHCFSSTRTLGEKALALGGYISLSGILTFKKSTDLQACAKDFPLHRLLVETDAPYLAPVPHRGKPCEPAFTRHTAEFLAELRGISYAEVASATTENFFRLFTKASKV